MYLRYGCGISGSKNSKSIRGKPKLSVENCSETLGYQGRQTGRKTGRKCQSIYHPTTAGKHTRARYKMGRQSQQSEEYNKSGHSLGSESYPRQSVQVGSTNTAVLDYWSSKSYRPLNRTGRSMVNCPSLTTLEANRDSLTEVAK